MPIETLSDFVALLAAVIGVAGGLLGLRQYFGYRTKRDQVEAVGASFRAVVASLGSDNPVDRRAGAILLRRFFDDDTEFGAAGTPYADEAVGVIAALLREEPSGSFQKLLADGLAYAPTLESADLQKTNLHDAWLVPRTGSDGADLDGADFFRADLTGASLKNASARGAAFYQARLNDTVFNGADLEDANFYEADLDGASFRGASLNRADFGAARNIPEEVLAHLDRDGKYGAGRGAGAEQPERAAPTVFVSRPGELTADQAQLVDRLVKMIDDEGFDAVQLSRPEYPKFGSLSEVRRLLGGSSGAVIVGVGDLLVKEGSWRTGTSDERNVDGQPWSTPWSQIEAGMAIGLNLPVLIVAEESLSGGVFDDMARDPHVNRVDLGADVRSRQFADAFTDWAATVRSRG